MSYSAGVIDTPSRCRGHEAFAQFLRHDKISHMIERERKFEPVLGKSAAGEQGSRVIDQDVNAPLLVGDFGGSALHLGHARQIGVINRMTKVWRPLAKPRQSRLSARL